MPLGRVSLVGGHPVSLVLRSPGIVHVVAWPAWVTAFPRPYQSVR